MVTAPQPYFTVKQAAGQLQVHPTTLRLWLVQGRVKGTLIAGQKTGWRIAESEIQRVLANGIDQPDNAA